jgi:pimeloyl-ACP methyl ester carboxylesterase
MPDAPETVPAETGFADVNGIRLYYEIHGDGEPLVLLHGGVAASEAFGPNLAALAASRRVVAVHLQGHGRTRDVEGRPLRPETMADDVAALIGHLGLGAVDVLGYSMGGSVALQTAIRNPEAVRRLIVVSQVMARDGWYPESLAAFAGMAAGAATVGAQLAQSPLARLYPDVDWVRLFEKIGDMTTRPYDWSADVAALPHPTLLVFADADAIRLDHIVAFYGLLGGGARGAGLDGSGRSASQLAIVPGATHYDILSTTAVADAAARFLGAPDRPGPGPS